jgi:hypothetical protein
MPAADALAQAMEPRAYSNLPVGLNFLLAGYAYSQGDVAFDASVPLTDADIRIHALPVAYVRTLDVLGASGSIALLLPIVDLSGTATLDGTTEVQRDVSGLADPMLRLAVNFHGAPALSAAEFRSYRQDLIVGASLTLGVPLGQYDADRLVNIGTNRWSVKPELGLSKALGPWIAELATGVTWFTRNDEFFNGNEREQEPLFSAQLHVIRDFGGGVWAAGSATYYEGGRTSINGIARDDRAADWRYGATLSLPVDRRNSIKLHAHSGLYARTGSSFQGVGITWQHRWM